MIDQKRKRLIREIYERQIDRVYRLALMYTGDPHDAEDVAESVFLTMIEKKITFENEEHEKAWFITSVRNRCRDLHKSSWRGKVQLVAPTEVYSENAGYDTVDDSQTEIENEAEIEAVKLPSTSPANAAWSADRLTEAWRADIRAVDAEDRPLVFLLWGRPAQMKAEMLHSRRHLVLTAPHPSPLSAYRGFFGCRHFSRTNDFLRASGVEPVDWQIENVGR